jgi:hypothetical protein
VFTLGNRQYDFRVKPRFPKRLSDEFLFVDALNNLGELAEDKTISARASSMYDGWDEAQACPGAIRTVGHPQARDGLVGCLSSFTLGATSGNCSA